MTHKPPRVSVGKRLQDTIDENCRLRTQIDELNEEIFRLKEPKVDKKYSLDVERETCVDAVEKACRDFIQAAYKVIDAQ